METEIMSDQDFSYWVIWIDDICGELAMDKNDLAKRKIEVVDKESFDAVVKERDELQSQRKTAVDMLNFRTKFKDIEIESLRMSVEFLRGLRIGYEQRLGIDSSEWLKHIEKEELKDEPQK